jgi:hypothetical protein
VIAALAVYAAGPAAAQRQVDERFAVRPDGMIRIHNLVGSVKVSGWTRDSIAVTGMVFETKTDRFEIHTGEGGTKLGIWDSSEQGLKPSHLEIRVPARSNVWVKTAGAEIVVFGVNGGVDLYSVSGNIHIEGAPREVYAESMGGGVTIAADTRSVRAKSGSGAIRLRGALTDLTATTVSGAIDVEGERVQRARFESVDGDIRWIGGFENHASLDFTSHAGAIEFALPSSAAAEFMVNTFEGGFDDRWGVKVVQGGSKLKGKELRFTIGAGGASVYVRTFKGPVVLRRG